MEKKVPNIENGTMARNFKDLQDLGKQMEHLRDGLELVEDNRIPDPIQVDDYKEEAKDQ
ncbi:hypothetical protein LSPCS325_41030 [Lysinibacillus sp. CTST325]|uniref:hypothetical protein n=1 Tax=Lysinibacillus sp. CNPSo 3705 TaxID=3028148 RepID=UPI0010CFB0A3|nr:hypothetical protein [Lysinibacillus sp. CNPSo 3705]MDD1502864.1 hypothetical protein [Lysinibacillus sp. CNPSo 3705]